MLKKLVFMVCMFLCSTVYADDFAPAPDQVQPLLVGTEIPEVALMTADGARFDLRAEIKQKPAVVIFYRGYW